MDTKKKLILERILSIFLFILVFFALLLINYQISVGIGIILIEVIVIVLKAKQIKGNKRIVAECAFFLIAAIIELFWLITSAYALYLTASLLALLLAVYLGGSSLRKQKITKQNSLIKVFCKIAASLISLVAILVVGFLMFTAFNPVPFIHMVQSSFEYSNSFNEHAKTKQNLLDDGTLLINDLQYGNTYPNSYLDIYISGGDVENIKPTYFFIHGGGFAWGDKVDGDPITREIGGLYIYFKGLLDAGYNIVSVNYAFAPEYKYPTPIYQIDEAVNFLQETGKQYGIDMTDVIFGGHSAGGQIAGQFVNIQTNSDYASKMGITPVISKDNIKAVVFVSSLLDSERMTKTGDHIFDWMLLQLGRIYFGNNSLVGQENVMQSNVITNTTEYFPPTFISDGNYASFNEQALELHNRLNQLGVKNTFNFYEKSEVELYHGYETDVNKYAQANMIKLLEFLKSLD